MESLFLAGRLLYGGFFIMSGYAHFSNQKAVVGYAQSKGVPQSAILVPASGLMLLAGGLGVILGVGVLYALGLIALFLLVASVAIHNYWADTDPMTKMGNRINFYKNMALLGAALTLMAFPEPWPMSWLIN